MRSRVAALCLLAAASALTWPLCDALVRSVRAQQQPAASQAADGPHRGPLVLYDFASAEGDVVRDRSGVGTPLDLRIETAKAVRRASGELEIRGGARIRSPKPAAKIHDAVRRSGAITIEAWVRPANTKQEGPARIVTLSSSPNERNITLGQDGGKYDARLRTTATSTNGIPSLGTDGGSLKSRPTHVVYTHAPGGRTRMYIDGRQAAEQSIGGSTSTWDGAFHLALANEQTGDRPWLGTFYLVAIYDRELPAEEVAQHFEAGHDARAVESLLAGVRLAHSAGLFEQSVAPMLLKHCFECHDARTKKGGLDLSRKAAALAGGESGAAIVPGKAGESLLWEHVAADEMPKKRPPLSAPMKKMLREWIDSGAVWTVGAIDPAVFAYDGRATQIWVRRLTVDEYIETVRGSIGVDIAEEARRLLPPDVRADGFRNTAYNLNVDLKHVEAYARLAQTIVERADAVKLASRFTKDRGLGEKNLRELVSQMGRWVLRGPLDDQEVEAFLDVALTVARAGGKFDEVAGYVLEAMLQSPRFIYRIERQRGAGTRRAGPFELASRLSYIIWGGPPDEELMRAAERGELAGDGQIEAQVRRMLADPRAVEQSKRFVGQWLNLERLANLAPSRKHFPDWDPRLAEDMRRETLAVFHEIVWRQKRPLAELFNAQVTIATPRLARHYGLEVASGDKVEGAADGAARYDLRKVPGRGGLLTQASVLTVGGDEASMVSRGLFVLRDVLRGTVEEPPPCVDTTPVPTKPGRTQRAIAEARIANTACGGCHAKFEPLAFGLERFDGLGTYHEQDEHDNRLRQDGEILFPGAAKPVAYKTSGELMDLLATSDRVRLTITWKLAQFALGRPLTARDAAILDKIHQSAWRSDKDNQPGGTYARLITALVTSDLVKKTRGDPSD